MHDMTATVAGARPRFFTRSCAFAGALGVLLCAPAPASAQIELAAINGTITDDSGAPLQGAVIKLTELGRGRVVSVKSGKDGKFYRRALPPESYAIVVELDGYQPIKDNVTLTGGRDQRFDFKLAKNAPVGAVEFQQGIKAFNSGDTAAAVAAFEDAVAKAPELPEARVNLAIAYLRASRPDDAIAQLEKAAGLAPDQPLILLRLGGAYVDVQKNEQAVGALEKGLAAATDMTDPLVYGATVTLGAVLFATGQNDEAIARFEMALAARPGDAAPALGLGKALFSKGDVDGALKQFKAVVASAPGTPEAAEADAFVKAIEKRQKP